jgi:hypothetical protein
MRRTARLGLLAVALFALSITGLSAQSPVAIQKPTDPQAAQGAAKAKEAQAKPADAKPDAAKEELPPEFKAFNAAGKEGDSLKRAEAYEKFITDFPKSPLVSTARSQIQSNVLATLKKSQAKYQELVKTQVETAKQGENPSRLRSTYSRIASDLLSTGALLDQAEEYSRNALSAMDEEKYVQERKQADQRVADSFAKRDAKPAAASPAAVPTTAAPPAAALPPAGAAAPPVAVPPPAAAAAPAVAAAAPGQPAAAPAVVPPAPGQPAAAPAPPPPPSVGGFTISMVDGVPFAKPAPPRAATPASSTAPRTPSPPRMPTDSEIRASFRVEKANMQATLGQILVKRGKTAEGREVLGEAYAARPASSTMAAISRVLADLAKKAGDDRGQIEYLTTLALTGRITADEQKEFDAVYRKTHNGSLDGVEEMLDERYRRDGPKFEAKPSTRPAKPSDRAVLVEMFTGAG